MAGFYYAFVESDGALTVKDSLLQVVWQYGGSSPSAYSVELSNSDFMVKGENGMATIAAGQEILELRTNARKCLFKYQCLKSSLGVRLCLESNGQLVFYDVNNLANWNSTGFKNTNSACLTDDGNFALLDQANTVLWKSSNVSWSGNTPFSVSLQLEGVSIMNVNKNTLWSSFGVIPPRFLLKTSSVNNLNCIHDGGQPNLLTLGFPAPFVLRACNKLDLNQQFSLNFVTKQIMNPNRPGFCVTDGGGWPGLLTSKYSMKPCTNDNPQQQFVIENVENLSGVVRIRSLRRGSCLQAETWPLGITKVVVGACSFNTKQQHLEIVPF